MEKVGEGKEKYFLFSMQEMGAKTSHLYFCSKG
jgi:hypothetical protein